MAYTNSFFSVFLKNNTNGCYFEHEEISVKQSDIRT